MNGDCSGTWGDGSDWLIHALLSVGIAAAGAAHYTIEHIRHRHTRAAVLEAWRCCVQRDSIEAGKRTEPNSGRLVQTLREGLRCQGPATLAAALVTAQADNWHGGELLTNARHPYDLAKLSALDSAGITGRNRDRLAWLFPLDYIAANIGKARKDMPQKAGPGLIVRYLRENRANFDHEAEERAHFTKQQQAAAAQAARAAHAARIAQEHAQQQHAARSFADQLAALTDQQAAEALEVALGNIAPAFQRTLRASAKERGARAVLASSTLSSFAAAAVVAVTTGARRIVPVEM